MKKWTKKEIEYLKHNFAVFSYFEISKRLKRSIGSIYWKAFEINLKKGRWNKNNKLNKKKVIKLLIQQKNRLGKSPSIREVPVAIKSACQRHFGNFNNAKRAAGLKIREYSPSLVKSAFNPSNELAYVVGLLLGDGSFRYQKSKQRTSYVISFASIDKELMDYFFTIFKKWSSYEPKISILKAKSKKLPNEKFYSNKDLFITQISFRDAWKFLKVFKDNPSLCLKFFPKTYFNWILKGLWDAEGCIRTENKSLRIHFTNANRDIIKLYTILLNKFNFIYSIHKGRTAFNIDIPNEYEILRFIKLINGITIRRKVSKLILKKINNPNINEKNFSERIYELVNQIPTGYVSTYRDIAHHLNIKAYRAVGQVLRRNKNYPEVPCFKVVKSNGSIGGFSGKSKGKKIQEKIDYLKKEGIIVKNNKVFNFEKVLHKFD